MSLATLRRADWPRIGLMLGGVALVAGILFGLLLPVYSDEVVWRFAERAAIDGFDKLSADTCGPNTLAVPPWFMWPVRWYSASFNLAFADPFWVRLSGVGYALALVAQLYRLAGRLAPQAGHRATLWGLGGGLLALGVMPLLLVLSRPEQPILLCLVTALLIAARGWLPDDPAAPGRATRRIGAILILATIALSYHPKATLLAPVFGFAILTCVPGSAGLIWRGLAVAVLAALSLTAAHYWSARFACPADPLMAHDITSANIVANLLAKHDWPAAAEAVARNFGYVWYLALAAPNPHPAAWWLPRGLLTTPEVLAWAALLFIIWKVALLSAFAAWLRGAWVCAVKRRWDPRLALSMLIFPLTMVWGAAQSARNVYEADFVLTLWLLAVWLAMTADGGWPRIWQWWRTLGLVAAVAGTMSVAALVATYAPSFARAAAQRDTIPAMPYSVPAFHYSAARADLIRAAHACHIQPDHRLNAPMVDENSYFLLMHSTRPQFHLVLGGVWQPGIKDPLGYLAGLHSDGALLACRNLSSALRARAHQVGDFCCIAPPDWGAPAKPAR